MPVTDRKKPVIFAAAAAGAVCLLVYLRTLSCGFINFDDPLYVLNNEAIRTLDGSMLAWAFSKSHAGFWMPLTWISLAVDYHFWELNPFGYHLTNIVLHALNTGLVVLLADRVLPGQWASGKSRNLNLAVLLLAGLLWGIHPLRVESVAWVTERKDVLNGLFALSSVLAYLRYARQRESGEPCRSAWLLSLGLFACSLLAKSVTVVLPVMFVVLDWYPLGRLRRSQWKRLLAEKAPFLLLALAMSIVTVVVVADSNVLVSYDVFPLGQRILVSGNAVFHYCRLLLLPVAILPLYPFPDPLPFSFTLTTIAVVIATCGCLVAGRVRPWLTAVTLCFLLPLLPVLALFQNGDQVMAARFTYLPSVAISIMAAAAIHHTAQKIEGLLQRSLLAGCAALLFFYILTSVHLIGYWKDTGTFWSRMIELKPIGRAYSDRGRFYLETGRVAEAVDDLTHAAEIATQVGMPEAFNLFAIRGEALAKLGRHEEAVRDFSTAISFFPAPVYFYHRGLSLMELGRKREAEEDLRQGDPESGPIKWYSAK